MKIIGIIPARFQSTRFPGKPLKHLLGKPILQWVIELVSKSKELHDYYVATDHEDIKKLCDSLKVKCIMTNSDCISGTDRVYQAISVIGECDAIINIQGDEPLLPTEYIDILVQGLRQNLETNMVTLAHPISLEELENFNSVKVILNQKSEALYFSRFSIPFSREKATLPISSLVQKHIGIYGFRKNFLVKFCSAPISYLEKHESLEQLRALEMGEKIKVFSVKEPTQGVDTPEDLDKIENQLKNRLVNNEN